ncbi:MAG: hypothetical protein NVS3B7_20440 [Candidatus Elarobacter sp.]
MLFVAAVCLALVVAHDRHSPAKRLIHTGTDFTAFYCAGEVVRQRGDPYRVEPLRTCEQRLNALPDRPRWFLTPVPFPGYALAAFAVLSLLPFETAHLLYIYVLFVAVGVTAWALARVTGFSFPLVALVLAPPLGLYDIGFGEPTPITAALLALAAERAHARAWPAAGAFVALGTLEPHLVLAAFFSLLVFVPASRVVVVAIAAVLGGISLLTIGFAENLAYFTRTLPTQAAAELRFPAQISLPHWLVMVHVPDRIALALGTLAFLAMLVVAVIAGRRLERLTGDPACLILIPTAVALVGGGNYTHENHILAALGAAILLAALPGVPRWLRVLPLVLLSVVWVSGSAWHGLLVANAAGAAGAIVLALLRDPSAPGRRVMYGCALALGLVVTFVALQRVPTPDAPMRLTLAAPAPAEVGTNDDASLLLARRNAVYPISLPDPRLEAEKIPMELGLILILAAAFAPIAARVDARRGRRRAG